jgi:hypothetical protein
MSSGLYICSQNPNFSCGVDGMTYIAYFGTALLTPLMSVILWKEISSCILMVM